MPLKIILICLSRNISLPEICFFIIITNVENRWAAYFYGNHDTFFFSWFSDEYKGQKNSIYLKYKYFVTLKMSLLLIIFNASLMN